MSKPLALAAALLLLPGLADAQSSLGRNDSVFTWRGALPARARLSVSNFNGPIEVRPASGSQVEFRAEKRTGRGGNPTDVSFGVETSSSGDVTICSLLGDRDSCSSDRRNNDRGWRDYGRNVTVAMTVLVPRGAQVHVATGNGAVSVENVGGEVQAATGNGRVRVNGTDGPVRVSTGNGDVEVRDARARVRATTGNGDVRVVTASGPVEVRSGNGDVDVRIATLTATDDMTFSTGSGSVHLTLPASYNGELEATTGNGEVHSDFDLKIRGRLDPRRIRATIGSGGPLLRLSSGNGRLEIRKGQ